MKKQMVAEDQFVAVEALYDLGKIYLKAKSWMSLEEHMVLCMTLLGFSMEEMSEQLPTAAEIEKILIRKFKYAITTPKAQDDDCGSSEEEDTGFRHMH